MRHYDSTSLKYKFQNLSRKPFDETKEQDTNLAFTDESRSIGPCLYTAIGFNAFEIKRSF